MSKLLQSSTDDGLRGETASSNGKVPALPPQQARSEPMVGHEWELQLKETPFDASTSSPPPVESGPAPGSESQSQFTYGFEVDV